MLPSIWARRKAKSVPAGHSVAAVAVLEAPPQMRKGSITVPWSSPHHELHEPSNPSVMIGAGLLAKKAVERGLARRPWVKTSLAPGRRW